MSLEGFVRVFNNSGEEYENAQVRLVVGTINIVEKIAQLANITESEVLNLKKEDYAKARRGVLGKDMSNMAGMSSPVKRCSLRQNRS